MKNYENEFSLPIHFLIHNLTFLMGVFLKYAITGVLFGWASLRRAIVAYPIISLSCKFAGISLVFFSLLFRLRIGDELVGKSKKDGKVPSWSYVIFWPFHLVNYVYMYLMKYTIRRGVPPATEILPNWWIGGWFSDQVKGVSWYGILDLTTEFPERTKSTIYLNVPVWDGNPPSVEGIEEAAQFIVANVARGPTLCHCAFGVGRSTTVLCAALVLGGKAANYEEALMIIKEKRPIVRLNSNMKRALQDWQIYQNKRKK